MGREKTTARFEEAQLFFCHLHRQRNAKIPRKLVSGAMNCPFYAEVISMDFFFTSSVSATDNGNGAVGFEGDDSAGWPSARAEA